jgi:hypothetical protein
MLKPQLQITHTILLLTKCLMPSPKTVSEVAIFSLSALLCPSPIRRNSLEHTLLWTRGRVLVGDVLQAAGDDYTLLGRIIRPRVL